MQAQADEWLFPSVTDSARGQIWTRAFHEYLLTPLDGAVLAEACGDADGSSSSSSCSNSRDHLPGEEVEEQAQGMEHQPQQETDEESGVVRCDADLDQSKQTPANISGPGEMDAYSDVWHDGVLRAAAQQTACDDGGDFAGDGNGDGGDGDDDVSTAVRMRHPAGERGRCTGDGGKRRTMSSSARRWSSSCLQSVPPTHVAPDELALVDSESDDVSSDGGVATPSPARCAYSASHSPLRTASSATDLRSEQLLLLHDKLHQARGASSQSGSVSSLPALVVDDREFVAGTGSGGTAAVVQRHESSHHRPWVDSASCPASRLSSRQVSGDAATMATGTGALFATQEAVDDMAVASVRLWETALLPHSDGTRVLMGERRGADDGGDASGDGDDGSSAAFSAMVHADPHSLVSQAQSMLATESETAAQGRGVAGSSSGNNNNNNNNNDSRCGHPPPPTPTPRLPGGRR